DGRRRPCELRRRRVRGRRRLRSDRTRSDHAPAVRSSAQGAAGGRPGFPAGRRRLCRRRFQPPQCDGGFRVTKILESTEYEWLAAQQLPNGAIVNRGLDENERPEEVAVNPYFANFAALGLVQ